MYKKYCDMIDCKLNLNKVCFNKKVCNSPPMISYGKNENSKKKKDVCKKGVDGVDVLTKREIEAFRYYNETNPKLSLSSIGDLMGITKQRVDVLIRNAKKKLKIGVDDKGIPLTNKKGIYKGGVDVSSFKRRHKINFHAEEITFDIDPVSFVNEKVSKLKFTEYKSIDTVEHHVKIFEKKVKVNFKRDIVGFEEDRVLLEADRRVINFIKNFNYFLKRNKIDGKIILKDKGRFLRVKRHWAIEGTQLSKDLRDRKEDLYVYDRDDGVLRLHFDLSTFDGHIELSHNKKADKDIKPIKRVFDEYLHDSVFSPKEVTDELNLLKSDYVKSVRESTEMNVWMAENQKSHKKVLGDIAFAIKELRVEIAKLNNKVRR